MPNHKFKIRLRKDEVVHEETLSIPEEQCFRLPFGDNMFVMRDKYVAETVIPYFDLLHDYSELTGISVDTQGRTYVRNYNRAKLLIYTYVWGMGTEIREEI
jgi:hypothetical protein